MLNVAVDGRRKGGYTLFSSFFLWKENEGLQRKREKGVLEFLRGGKGKGLEGFGGVISPFFFSKTVHPKLGGLGGIRIKITILPLLFIFLTFIFQAHLSNSSSENRAQLTSKEAPGLFSLIDFFPIDQFVALYHQNF